MLSLDNAYEEADIRAWGDRILKNLGARHSFCNVVAPSRIMGFQYVKCK